MIYNVYCDESCHLENDESNVMVLGALSCPTSTALKKFKAIRQIKAEYGFADREVKWGKVAPSNVELYQSLIQFFFDDSDLQFRAVVIRDKSKLDYKRFDHDHDTWYYKMYFLLLQGVLTPAKRFRVYLDIKDTNGGAKARKLHQVLCNSQYDFERSIIERVQQVKSEEVELIQLADILIGALSYRNRGLSVVRRNSD